MYASDRVYAVQWDGTLSAWDTTGATTNRAPLWSKLPAEAGVTFLGQPSLAGDRLIVRDSTGHVQGIRLTDGASLWTTTSTVTWNNGPQPMLVSGTTFFTTGVGDAVVSFSTTDGSAKWGGNTTGVGGTWYAEATDGTRVFAQQDCELYAFNVADGSTAWHTPIVTDSPGGCSSVYSPNGSPIVVDGLVYAVTPFGRMVANAVTGAPVLRFASYNYQQGQGVVAGGLWIFDNDDRTVAVDTTSGEVAWSVPDNGDNIRYSVVGDLVLALGAVLDGRSLPARRRAGLGRRRPRWTRLASRLRSSARTGSSCSRSRVCGPSVPCWTEGHRHVPGRAPRRCEIG